MSAPVTPPSPPTLLSRLEGVLMFLLLATITFSFPNKPSFDLDASWRMALGKFFLDGLQFGRDIVFTYGPLGFLMGKTYSGLMFWSLLLWQVVASSAFAYLVLYWGRRLPSAWTRFFYYAFFLLFGLCYEDALHMLVITLMAFELLRRVDRPWHWSSTLMILLLAVQSAAKFTNLMLAGLAVVTVAALALWQGRRGTAVRLLAWFGGAFLLIWVLCGQNPLNLPAYFINSWHVSQGYQEVMGIPTPPAPLYKALGVIAVLGGYLLLNLCTQPDRPRAVASTVVLGAFLFLNWKHGFVRADGHMVGFFYCALLPIVAFPILLQDPPSFRRLKRWALTGAGVLCLLGIRDTLPPLIDSALTIFQSKVWHNVNYASRLPTLRAEEYDNWLAQEVQRYAMPRTKTVVGDRSIDILGFNQAIALYNQLNYRPRPVFQSYSVYTPELARLNADFYRSDRAPDFILLRVGSIDERLSGMDDSDILYLITQRYTYVLSEKSFQLWRRTDAPLEASAEPQPLKTETLAVGQPWSIAEYNQQPLWIRIDLRPSWLGRLRSFLYKPAELRLAVLDTAGTRSLYRMAAPIGRTGFIINPVIDDLMSFTHFASDTPERQAAELTLVLAPEDRKYYAGTARVELSRLQTSTAAQDFFTNLNRERFYMFKTAPTSVEASNQPSNETIDDVQVMVVHTPSEMTFDVPPGATEVRGRYGFLAGAYVGENRTNGADFVIVWSDGKDSVEIYRQRLDPLVNPKDRGLKFFRASIKPHTGGRLYLRTLPGAYNDAGWDWTAWTEIEIK